MVLIAGIKKKDMDTLMVNNETEVGKSFVDFFYVCSCFHGQKRETD